MVDEEPDWPVAGSPPPDQSPYQSVLSSANPDSYPEPTPPEPPAQQPPKIDRSKIVGAGPKHRASGRLSKSTPLSSVYAAAQATSARAAPQPPPEAAPQLPPGAAPPQLPPGAVPRYVPPEPDLPPGAVPQYLPPEPVPSQLASETVIPAQPAAPGSSRPMPPLIPPAPHQPMPYPLAADPFPQAGYPVIGYPVPAPVPTQRTVTPVPQPVQPVFVTSGPPAPSPAPPRGGAGRARKGLTDSAKRLITVSVVLVLVVGLGLTGYFVAWPIWTQSHVTLVAPNHVLGLDKIESSTAFSYPQSVVTHLKDAGYHDTLVAGYATTSDTAHVVLVLGGTGFTLWTDDRVRKLFDTIGKGPDLPLAGAIGVDAGRMGGSARCATSTYQGEPVAVCGWVDHGSAVIVIFYNRTRDEGEVLMRAVRPGILHRT